MPPWTVNKSAHSLSPFTRTVRGVITVEKERVYPGSRQTVTLTLTDAAGNPVSGERVDWHLRQWQPLADTGHHRCTGRATTTWESTMPGAATITADAYGQQYTARHHGHASPDGQQRHRHRCHWRRRAKTLASVSRPAPGRARNSASIRRMPPARSPWTASSPAVSINGNIMTVKSNPAGVTLTGTDADGQTVTLNMGSNWFAQSAIEYRMAQQRLRGNSDSFLPPVGRTGGFIQCPSGHYRVNGANWKPTKAGPT
ncbi:Ig-like domain-containing protein [Escherichia coli]